MRYLYLIPVLMFGCIKQQQIKPYTYAEVRAIYAAHHDLCHEEALDCFMGAIFEDVQINPSPSNSTMDQALMACDLAEVKCLDRAFDEAAELLK